MYPGKELEPQPLCPTSFSGFNDRKVQKELKRWITSFDRAETVTLTTDTSRRAI
jgi:hypothetical protein